MKQLMHTPYFRKTRRSRYPVSLRRFIQPLGIAALLCAATSANAACMTAEQMLDGTPATLTDVQPCDLTAELFLEFNGIAKNSWVGLAPPADPDHGYYMVMRLQSYLTFIDESESPLDRDARFMATLSLLDPVDERKRASYQNYILFEFAKLHDGEINRAVPELQAAIQLSAIDTGFSNDTEVLCLIKSDVPGVGTSAVINSLFYQTCLQEIANTS